MEILVLFAATLFVFMLAQVIALRLRLRAQQREFADFKSSVVIVPMPKKKQSPWIAVLAISTLILSVALLVLAVR